MLFGKRVALRSLERADLPTIVRWFNDPEVRARLARVEAVSLAEEERWFESLLRSTTEVVFAIDSVDDDVASAIDADDFRFVGTCGLHRIDWRNRNAVVGIVIGDVADRHVGVGTDTLRCLLRHAFESLGLYRLELEVLTDNDGAIACYERLGFVTEGVRVGARYLGGRFVDLQLMRLLASEWSQATSPTPPKGTQPRRKRV